MSNVETAAVRAYKFISALAFVVAASFAVGFAIRGDWISVLEFLFIAAVFAWLWTHWRSYAHRGPKR